MGERAELRIVEYTSKRHYFIYIILFSVGIMGGYYNHELFAEFFLVVKSYDVYYDFRDFEHQYRNLKQQGKQNSVSSSRFLNSPLVGHRVIAASQETEFNFMPVEAGRFVIVEDGTRMTLIDEKRSRE
jgi:hypothetical protein